MANTPLYEAAVLFLMVFIHLYRFNFWISFAYFVGGNITYNLAILPDHDTFET